MSVLLEREAELLQQRATLLVVGRRRDDRDVHAAGTIDPVLVNLVEHDLLGEAEGVVATAVELAGVEAAEVTDAWQRQRQQPVQELPHPVPPERHVRPDRHTLTQFELGDGLAGLGHHRLLTGDHGQVADRALDQLGVARGLADAHVDHDLGQAGHLHDVADLELAAQRRDDLLAVTSLETRRDLLLGDRVGPAVSGGLGHVSDLLPGLARDANAARAGVRRPVGSPLADLLAAVTHASHAVALRQHHVGHMDGGLRGDDPAGRAAAAALLDDLGVLLDPIHTLDDHSLLLAEHLEDLALGALVLARDHLDGVALLDLHRVLPHSEHLRCEGDDLHEPLVSQLAAHGAEDARTARLAVLAQDHRGVLVELDVRAVGTPAFLAGAHHHGLHDVSLLDVAAGDGVLDRADDDVTDAGVATAGAAEHPDAQDFLGTGVVGDFDSRLLLDHFKDS